MTTYRSFMHLQSNKIKYIFYFKFLYTTVSFFLKGELYLWQFWVTLGHGKGEHMERKSERKKNTSI